MKPYAMIRCFGAPAPFVRARIMAAIRFRRNNKNVW